MNIRRAYIYGFGQFVDDEFDFSEHRFVTVFGENESGKSTLQAFILFMLFGLPPKIRKYYRPKTSGKMGGRLVLIDDEAGEFSIERFDEVNQGAAVCYDQNGNKYDEKWLTKRLNSLSEHTFLSIFSFSAIDLIQFKQMKATDLDELLLSVGLTGSHRVYEVEKKLTAQMGELFKPFGKVPIINQQLQLLDDLNIETRELLEQSQAHRTYQVQLESLLQEMSVLEIRLKEKQVELKKIEKRKYALPLIQEARYYAKQLESIPTQLSFPEDGIERLQKIKDTLAPLKSEWQLLQTSLVEMIATQAEIASKRLDPQTIKDIHLWLKKQAQYIQDQQKERSIEERLQQLTTTFKMKLTELDIQIDETVIDKLRLPFHIEKRWQEFRSRHEELKLVKQQSDQVIQQLRNQKHYLLNQIYELESELLDEQEILSLEECLNQHAEHQYMRKVAAESTQKREVWQKKRKKQTKQVTIIFGSSLVLAMILSVVTYLYSLPFGYVLAAFLSAIGISLWLSHRQTVKQMERLLTTELPEQSHYEHVAEGEHIEAKHRLEAHEQIKQQIMTLESELKLLEGQIISEEEKKWQMKKMETTLQDDVNQELALFPFLRPVHVSHWSDVYYHLNELVRLRREINTLEEEKKQLLFRHRALQKQLDAFIINKLSDQMHVKTSDQFDSYFEMLEQTLQRQQELEQQDHQLKEQIEVTQERLKSLRETMKVYERDKAFLFSIAEVNQEEDFYKAAKTYHMQKELKQKYDALIMQLATMFHERQIKELLLTKFDEKELEFNDATVKKEIVDIEDQIAEKRQEVADLKALIISLESSEAYSQKMHEFELERAELQQLAKKWAVLRTAQEILTKTKRYYRKKHLTKLMEATTKFFTQITDGKYKTVLPPTEKHGFQLISHDDMIYEVSELSQGTVDQLYISLRFALSETMNERFKLPLLIDDAFVHSDLTRTNRILSILKVIAEQQQVILLTCKPYIVNELSDTQIIQLERTSAKKASRS